MKSIHLTLIITALFISYGLVGAYKQQTQQAFRVGSQKAARTPKAKKGDYPLQQYDLLQTSTPKPPAPPPSPVPPAPQHRIYQKRHANSSSTNIPRTSDYPVQKPLLEPYQREGYEYDALTSQSPQETEYSKEMYLEK